MVTILSNLREKYLCVIIAKFGEILLSSLEVLVNFVDAQFVMADVFPRMRLGLNFFLSL